MIVSGMRKRGGAIDDFFATSGRKVFENEASLPRGSHPLDQLNRLETQDFEDMVRPPTKLADSAGEQNYSVGQAIFGIISRVRCFYGRRL
jgi:hypothetical protein